MLAFGDGLVVAQDVVTLACAAVNAGYFALYRRRSATAGRRLGASVLALLYLGVAAEGVYLVSLYAAHRLSPAATTSLLAPAPWLLARLFLFLGTASTTALVLRQWRHR